VGSGSDFVKRALFAKQRSFWTISKRLKIPVYSKSGEFRNKGTIRLFPGPYRPRIGFFHVGEKNPG